MLWRLGWPISQPWSWTWVVAELLNLPAFPHSHCGQRGALKHCFAHRSPNEPAVRGGASSVFRSPGPTHLDASFTVLPSRGAGPSLQLLQGIHMGEAGVMGGLVSSSVLSRLSAGLTLLMLYVLSLLQTVCVSIPPHSFYMKY